MSGEPNVDKSEPQLTITLPVSMWSVIVAYLRAGMYDDVASILSTIGLQLTQQMDDAQLQARAREEREALAALQAIQTPAKGMH